jgi:SAM-dependent methyltransferase
MLDGLQYRILRKIAPRDPKLMQGSAYDGRSKIGVSLGEEFLAAVRDKVVIDFGCGDGTATLDLARAGAKKVIGVDIIERALSKARRQAEEAGLGSVCEFLTNTNERADVIISLDAFEHFGDPGAILQSMHELLKPGGCVMASFGPTWYHPLGGHLFSVFPWSHLLFSESALMRWRGDLRADNATRFSDVEGGLNQMTIRRFEQIVKRSPFRVDRLQTVPIRSLARIASPVTREFTTAVVRAKLVPIVLEQNVTR